MIFVTYPDKTDVMKNAFAISGPAIGSALYSIGGFGVPFWTVGSLGLVCAVLIFFLLPSVKPKSTDSSDGNSKKHLTVKAIFSVSAHYIYKICLIISFCYAYFSLLKCCYHFLTTLLLLMEVAFWSQCWNPI